MGSEVKSIFHRLWRPDRLSDEISDRLSDEMSDRLSDEMSLAKCSLFLTSEKQEQN